MEEIVGPILMFVSVLIGGFIIWYALEEYIPIIFETIFYIGGFVLILTIVAFTFVTLLS